jgi:hypothetical protein
LPVLSFDRRFLNWLNAPHSFAAQGHEGGKRLRLIATKCEPKLQRRSRANLVAKGSAWIGTPDDIREAIISYDAQVGGFESASLQVNFGMISQADAECSMRLFAQEVMPHFKKQKGSDRDCHSAARIEAET